MTELQAKALAFIKRFLAEHDHSPSTREIMAAIGVNSTGRAHEVISALVERGEIYTLPNRKRSIRLTPYARLLGHYPTTMLIEELGRRSIALGRAA